MIECGTSSDVGAAFDPRNAHRDDPFPFLREARSAEPVFYAESLRAWCVTRHDDITAVLRDHGSFSVREHNPSPTTALPPEVEQALGEWRGEALPLGSLDSPEHTRIRAVVNTGFTRTALKASEPRIRATARSMARRLAREPGFEFISEFSKPYALMVILEVLGIPGSFHARFDTWTDQRIKIMTAHEGTDPDELRECARGLLEYGRFARELVAERLARPRDDLISRMLHECPHGHRLSVDETIAQIPTLITAGYRTAAETLATVVWNQARTAGGWAVVVSGDVPLEDLVEEGLRFDCPIAGMYRTALRDVEIGGVRIPAGGRVLLVYGSANRDETKYACPEQFRPGRVSTTHHLAFGLGEHFCIGAPLGRTMLRIALEELAAAMPGLTLADRAEPTYQPTFPFRVRSALPVLTTAPGADGADGAATPCAGTAPGSVRG
ncbi:cytochrome P450 [Saccharothrix deserti]|uniref:cytochrome P450 n=1 Tax=Saccharothrix deserti TaxID=2593674 RepID=UPI00131E32FB|nr:cytochrome P450 [Saccharothrix deserti]